MRAKAERIFVRIESGLKKEASAKAAVDGTDLSAVVTNALMSFVAGPFNERDKTEAAREYFEHTLTEFRATQAAVINLLLDLRYISLTQKDSPLAEPAVAAMLTEVLECSRDCFKALGRPRNAP